MAKLTDAQLIILSAAAQREDGAALPLAKAIKLQGAAATRALGALLKAKLLTERPAALDAPAWRTAKNGRRGRARGGRRRGVVGSVRALNSLRGG